MKIFTLRVILPCHLKWYIKSATSSTNKCSIRLIFISFGCIRKCCFMLIECASGCSHFLKQCHNNIISTGNIFYVCLSRKLLHLFGSFFCLFLFFQYFEFSILSILFYFRKKSFCPHIFIFFYVLFIKNINYI